MGCTPALPLAGRPGSLPHSVVSKHGKISRGRPGEGPWQPELADTRSVPLDAAAVLPHPADCCPMAGPRLGAAAMGASSSDPQPALLSFCASRPVCWTQERSHLDQATGAGTQASRFLMGSDEGWATGSGQEALRVWGEGAAPAPRAQGEASCRRSRRARSLNVSGEGSRSRGVNAWRGDGSNPATLLMRLHARVGVGAGVTAALDPSGGTQWVPAGQGGKGPGIRASCK